MTAPASPRSAAAAEFERRFGEAPTMVARAPGRVNLIGEHTDYNEGFVLPVAIDREVCVAFQPWAEPRVEAYSVELAATGRFEIADAAPGGGGWIEYVHGVAWALSAAGRAVPGWRGVVASNVPVGAGLSSSAALELAAARVFVALDDGSWDPAAMALVAQRAEREWVGVNCGIMDQLVSAAGVRGHALLIDCWSLATRPVPIPPEATVVVLDTTTRRGLVESAYNERRRQCNLAAEALGLSALREIDEDTFAARASELAPMLRQRARHVVSENARTLRAATALENGALTTVGVLMNASHASLRDDFEVSRLELDVMAELAQADPACFGARMTGAGFGGCVVALVKTEAARPFAAAIARGYEASTGLTPAVHICSATGGASVERVGL